MPLPQQSSRPLQAPLAQAAGAPPPLEPPPPRNIDETGLSMGFLSDLVMKVMYFEGYISGATIAERLKLPFTGVVDQVLEFLKREQSLHVSQCGVADFAIPEAYKSPAPTRRRP